MHRRTAAMGGRRGSRLLAVAAACLLSVDTSWPLGRHGASTTPLWTTDLTKEGYSLPGWAGTDPNSERGKIAFGSEHELVVLDNTEPTRKPSPLNAFVLDAGTGGIVRRVQWTARFRPRIFATAGGGYAVFTGDRGTMLYAAGLEHVVAKTDEEATLVSPDGRSLLVDASESRPGHAIQRLLDADTLRPTRAEFLNADIESISSHAGAEVEEDADTDGEVVVIDGPSGEIDAYSTKCEEVSPRFLSDDTLAILGCGRIDVVRPGAGRICRLRMGRYADLEAVARDGSRFAVLEMTWSPGHWGHLQPGTAHVFDSGTCAELFTKHISTPHASVKDFASGLALSPDGTLLAINTLGQVSLFRLPPKRSGGSTGSGTE